ncbi:MAG: GlsB/YeaQ/YmgE family stress response membrane protein [Saprospiraceae bacterium]|nr:GlsB/YeaQ/YmgE family stress response membrane protein [Saprospiraceae bacterium]
MEILGIIALGAVAGYISGRLAHGEGFSFLENVIVGVIGSIIGAYVFQFLGIDIGYGIIGKLVTAVVGSLIALWLISMIGNRSPRRRRR